MPATWIADALRTGGCLVDETRVADWKTRGHTDGPTMDDVVGVMGHHTAGPAAGDLPSFGTVLNGRPDLAGPLANLMLSRAGVWVTIAAGRPWHAGAADNPAAWPWIPDGDANGHVLGIEAESDGAGDWTPAQLTAYPQGVAALLRYRGLGADRFLGHLEWAPRRKVDPAGWPGGLVGFRATVNGLLGAVPAPHPPAIAWTLPAGHYYGNIAGPAQSHGGINATERAAVKVIQAWLIYHGCVAGLPSSAWSTSGWADGVWGPPTDAAMATWHARFYPGQPKPTQCWSDDLRRLQVA